jgi:hypothetical protein
MSTELPEQRTSLASLVAAPLIWAAHFLLSYVTAAIWCAKVAGADLGGARAAIAVYTVAALLSILVIGWRAARRHRLGDSPHDRDSPEARHRFVAFATLLLAGLSAIAIIYAALAAALVGSCR